ncbi:MAG TPA: polysaccharide biosynthesis C-terminal domain-containing protein, partial [Chitinophagales bacterium]|nr:polysaccharide biosynthesis C-terminal domain-containing protein [Chitinophagales bacterium]
MSILKQLASQTAVYGMSSIIGRLLNYLLVPIYTYKLADTADYGVVTEMYAYAGFFTVLFTYGMETAYFRFAQSDNREKVFSTALGSLIASSVILTLMMLLGSGELAKLLTKDTAAVQLSAASYRNYVTWFALILAFDALAAIPFASLRLQNQAARFALLKLMNIGCNMALNLYFIVAAPWLVRNMGVAESFFVPSSAQVAYIFLSNLAASGITFLCFVPGIFKTSWRFDSALWKKMLAYAVPLMIVGFAGAVNEMLDRVLLKFLLPYSYEKNMAELGIYGACYKLSILMTLFIQAYRYAAEPFFFSESKKADAKENYAHAMRYFVIAGCIIFLGVMLYIDLVKYFIAEKYHAGLRVVPVLLLANFFLGIYYNLSVWYKLTDKTMKGAYIAMGGAVITIALNALLIPVMGYMGSAWATLICYVFMAAVSFRMGQRHFPIPYELGRIGFYLLL